MLCRGHPRKGDIGGTQVLVMAVVIMGAIVALLFYLGILDSLVNSLMSTLDKRFGNLLVGLGE